MEIEPRGEQHEHPEAPGVRTASAVAVAVARSDAGAGGQQHGLPAELRADVAENPPTDEQESAREAHDGSAEKKSDPLQRGVEVLHGSRDKVLEIAVTHQDAPVFLTPWRASLMLSPRCRMKRLPAFFLALLMLSCSRPAPQGRIATVDLVPSRQRALAQSDSEPVVTTWLPVGMSFVSARASILYGLLVSDSPVLDVSHKPVGGTLRRGLRVTIADATPWEAAGRDYKKWYQVREQGSSKDAWVDSADVALITVENGPLSGGFLERKIAVSGGESEYNLLVLCDGTAVSLIDSSAIVFPDAFHPSGVMSVSLEDVNSDGAPKAVVRGQTIVSLQFLGASPLAWEAWLKEKGGSWGVIFRFNSSYGTDQGNSYSATRRVFSSTGAGVLDTVKVTTDMVETMAEGFSTPPSRPSSCGTVPSTRKTPARSCRRKRPSPPPLR